MNKVYNRRCYLRAFFIAFIVLVIAVCAAARVYAEPARFGTLAEDYSGKLVIISTNDVHGQLDRYQYVAGLRDELVNNRNAEVLIVDSGDYLQGSSNVAWDRGASAVRMMNKVGYAATAVGNHEFDYSWERLGELSFMPVLTCINVVHNGTTLFPRYVKFGTEDSSVTIGFFGVTTPFTTTSTSPSHLTGLTFYNNDTEPSWIAQTAGIITEMRDQDVDIVIGLTHLGVDKANIPYRSYDLLEDLSKNAIADEDMMPDILLDGHSHTVMTEGTDGQRIMSTGTKLVNVGITVIDKGTKKIEDWFLYKVDDIKEAGYSNDAVEQEWLDIKAEMEAKYSEKIGESRVELNGAEKASEAAPKYPNGNRDGETNLGDLFADSFKYVAVTEKEKGRTYNVDDDHIIGFENGGALRDYIRAGEINMMDLLKVASFYNSICGVYVKGSDLLEVLEAATQYMPANAPSFPQVSGIDFSIDLRYKYKPAAEPYPGTHAYGPAEIRRVTINSVNGKPFDPDATYLVFMNDFCAEGGGLYYKFGQSENKFETGVLDLDAVASYISSERLGGVIGEEYAEPKGRIHIETPVIEVKDVKTTYNKKTPKIPEPTVTGIDGEIKYRYYSDKEGKKEISATVNAGTYYYKAYFEGDDTLSPAESNIATITISRASAKIKAIKPAKKKIKKGKTFKLTVSKTSGSGKVTYKKVKGTRLIKVTKGGKVKVIRKCRKGRTYTIKVRATAKKNKNFNSAKRTQKVKIVVK